jgi:nicotinamidase-related amidase
MSEPTYIDDFTREVAISPRTTALLIVDMQNASGSRHHGLGRMLAQTGQLAEAEYRFRRIEELLIPNISRLADTFRRAGARVIYVTYGCTLPDFSDAPLHLRRWLIATKNRAGMPEHEIVRELAPRAGEPVLNKTTMGAFGSTGIDALLRSLGISELVVTGVSTNNCVGMTAMEASDRQYGVVLVDDATGTCSDAMQQATLSTWRRLWGRVMSTDEVIAAITRDSGRTTR